MSYPMGREFGGGYPETVKFSTIFLILYLLVFSITCFICSSDTDPLCADPFNNSSTPLSDCKFMRNPHREVLPAVCRKVKQRGNYLRLIFFNPSNFDMFHCIRVIVFHEIKTMYVIFI
ncbi:unnamed protein product [Diatraea saccharalis]|uniref:Uncharacterized protein n=1 Tax=Diatraea saccharalis TaxID=40085 RepID=A0A9N9WDK9_9NEOP|nr:unnamed protein product [Diatraea saccharalis]